MILFENKTFIINYSVSQNTNSLMIKYISFANLDILRDRVFPHISEKSCVEKFVLHPFYLSYYPYAVIRTRNRIKCNRMWTIFHKIILLSNLSAVCNFATYTLTIPYMQLCENLVSSVWFLWCWIIIQA